jgi:cellulose synthase/poly-beta-1,6-N-acetylglucosamine synthase-like glycosyltransferase
MEKGANESTTFIQRGDYYDEKGNYTKEGGFVPFPTGATYIPHLDERDYKATIIISTPDTESNNFRYCKRRLDSSTPGIHRRLIVQTNFNEKPYNWSRDMNIGLRVPDTDYYIIMNDDIFVEPGWLDELVKVARQDKKIGIVGGTLLYPGSRIVQHAGGGYNEELSWSENGAIPTTQKHFGEKYDALLPDLKQEDVPWVAGALILVTKECVRSIGVMDEQLVGHSDDIEYCFRAWLNGFRVVYTPSVASIHRDAVTRQISAEGVPNFVSDALLRLMDILPKAKADHVMSIVEESNRVNY